MLLESKDKAAPIAFVAMKITQDHWRDRIYLAIKDVLEEAGYECIRADEIRTSGAIVEEECRLLREADLVVIDSSGDSHSVSYEIGFCHGNGRSTEHLLLLRDNPNLPFNYRHYRHLVYRDIRHLKRLIRAFLKVSEPLALDQYGYIFTFSFSENCRIGYILNGARCVFDILRVEGFSGRCECYSAERFEIPGRFFSIGLMLRHKRKPYQPTYPFWIRVQNEAAKLAMQRSIGIQLETDLSELAAKRAMLHDLLPCGSAEFENGQIIRIFGSEDEQAESFFHLYLNRAD